MVVFPRYTISSEHVCGAVNTCYLSSTLKWQLEAYIQALYMTDASSVQSLLACHN